MAAAPFCWLLLSNQSHRSGSPTTALTINVVFLTDPRSIQGVGAWLGTLISKDCF
jgi:hypothetical protein